MAHDLRQNVISTQYFENKLAYFHQILCVHSYCQDLALDCYRSCFPHTLVMALDLHPNFISAQYLKNQLTYFHQILYMDLY